MDSKKAIYRAYVKGAGTEMFRRGDRVHKSRAATLRRLGFKVNEYAGPSDIENGVVLPVVCLGILAGSAGGRAGDCRSLDMEDERETR